MPGFDRITFHPHLMGGRACIRGMRITVSLIINLLANGMKEEEIIEAYPDLGLEDIHQALRYAAWLAEEQVQPLDVARDSWPTWASQSLQSTTCAVKATMPCICEMKGCNG